MAFNLPWVSFQCNRFDVQIRSLKLSISSVGVRIIFNTSIRQAIKYLSTIIRNHTLLVRQSSFSDLFTEELFNRSPYTNHKTLLFSMCQTYFVSFHSSPRNSLLCRISFQRYKNSGDPVYSLYSASQRSIRVFSYPFSIFSSLLMTSVLAAFAVAGSHLTGIKSDTVSVGLLKTKNSDCSCQVVITVVTIPSEMRTFELNQILWMPLLLPEGTI